MKSQNLSIRWLYLAVGVLAMLFAGIIYAWSILKGPLGEAFQWSKDDLALNFTLTMCCFCLGGFLGSKLSAKLGVKLAIILAGLLGGVGFVVTGLLNGQILLLYVTYAVLAGLGIGIAYNVVISTVNAWFPDKKGLCSGCLMMGFGASALVLGSIAENLFAMENVGWRMTYIILGISLAVVLLAAGLILKRPDKDVVFPTPKPKKMVKAENFEPRNFTTGEMLKRPSFWMAFVCLGLLGAVGSSVISFAKDLALSVGAQAALATTLVGVLSVCNGFGRILTGALFDAVGRRITMLAANCIAIAAAGVTLLAVAIHSLPLCIVGLCLVGMSYGACPTVSSALVSTFYGTEHFPTNFSIMNFNLIGSSLIATACSSLLTAAGGYNAPFALLLGLALIALVLNLIIRKP